MPRSFRRRVGCLVERPLLVGVTFGAGLAACWVYKNAHNIPAIGVAHGVVTFCLYYGLPRDITHNLRVGPGFLAT